MPGLSVPTIAHGASWVSPEHNAHGFNLFPVIALGVLLLAAGPGFAEETEQATPTETVQDDTTSSDSGSAAQGATAPEKATGTSIPDEENDELRITAYYKHGLHLKSADGNFAATFKWRAQSRLTYLTSPDLVGEEDGIDEEDGFEIRRARFKLNGHAYRPWLKYYLEYGIAAGNLLTFQFDLQPYEKAGLRVGQYKVLYNRERVDSSGKLQFADRSIVNSPFTVDRQSGLTALGHLFKNTRGDSKWAAGVFTGTGRGGPLDDDRRPMYTGRWQWNFLKRDLPFSESDIKSHEKPAASFALAASSNVSRFTRFSSSGGGQISGFSPGESGQYKLQQWMAEYAHQYQGLSIQAEYHSKRIDDRVNNQITEMDGFYAQAGYFFHNSFDAFPRPLELAVRIAAVDSQTDIEIPADREATFAVNWFFSGHNNKLTADVSRLESSGSLGTDDDGWRARVQWDITF